MINFHCNEQRIAQQIGVALRQREERFAARWLMENSLSVIADALLVEAEKIYETFYARLRDLDQRKFKIETWDAGWYQVRGALKDAGLLDDREFRRLFAMLGEKLLPQIYEFGFLRDEVFYYD